MNVQDRHEYGCARGIFPDLPCGCLDGPRVTPDDVRHMSARLLEMEPKDTGDES